MRRLLAIVILAAGCGGPVAVPITPEPSVVQTSAPTSRPTPAAVASPDHETCELSLEAATVFGDNLLPFGLALADEDADAAQDIIDRTVRLARAIRELAELETGSAWRHWIAALQAIDDAELAHLTGDEMPFIDALGDAAMMRSELVVVCS